MGFPSWGLMAMPSTDWPWFSRQACALHACQRVRQVHRSSCPCRLGRSAVSVSPGETHRRGRFRWGFSYRAWGLEARPRSAVLAGPQLGQRSSSRLHVTQARHPWLCGFSKPDSGALRGVPAEGGAPKTAMLVEASGEGFPPLNTILTTGDWDGFLTGVGARMLTVTRLRLC